MRQVETFPTNEWADTNNWIMASTCPKCHHLNCNQLLNVDGKITLYMCQSCNHEWQPYTNLVMETITINCRCKLI